MSQIIDWLAGTALSRLVRGEAWAWPLVELLHIAGFSAFIGALLLVDLRVLATSRTVDLAALGRFARPVILGGLAVAVLTGSLMFIGRPIEYVANPAFQAKLLLIALALANALAFHARDGIVRADAVARAQALASIVLWALVLGFGRFIAYV
jgi:hypothetical protein